MQPKWMTSKIAYHQPDDIPENLIIWQDQNHGIAAYVQAGKDIIAGKKVTFALCKREGTLTPEIEEIVIIAMGDGGNPADGYQPTAPRYCGENNDPNGTGSHALIPSWYDYCNDPAAIATALALAFSHHELAFRIR